MEPQKESNKTIYLVIGVLILAVLFSLSLFTGSKETKEASSQNNDIVPTNDNQAEVKKTISTNDTSDTEMTVAEPIMQDKVAGIYTEYDAQTVADSKAENIILFFHATWCPSCRALNENINDNLTEIPAGTEIYKVDYDTYTELKKKYGITTQHTLVLIENDGTIIKKWSGSPTLEKIISSI